MSTTAHRPGSAGGSDAPGPLHGAADIDHLVAALSEIWAQFSLQRAA